MLRSNNVCYCCRYGPVVVQRLQLLLITVRVAVRGDYRVLIVRICTVNFAGLLRHRTQQLLGQLMCGLERR